MQYKKYDVLHTAPPLHYRYNHCILMCELYFNCTAYCTVNSHFRVFLLIRYCRVLYGFGTMMHSVPHYDSDITKHHVITSRALAPLIHRVPPVKTKILRFFSKLGFRNCCFYRRKLYYHTSVQLLSTF